jgi:hypothetical protein
MFGQLGKTGMPEISYITDNQQKSGTAFSLLIKGYQND